MLPKILKNIIKSKEFKDIITIAQGITKVSSHFIESSHENQSFYKNKNKTKIKKDFLQHEEFEKLKTLKIEKKEYILKEQKVPSTPLSRTLVLGGTVGSIAGDYMLSRIKENFSFFKSEKNEEQNKIPSFINEKNADLLSETLCRMRGAALKLGQALSIQEDKLIPPFIKEAFEKSRSFAHKMPQKQLEEVMVKELGKNYEDLFESFEKEPFAAASIGQVHRGVLKNGMKVAIKIQYPGVSKSIDSDIDSLAVLVKYFGILPKSFFFDNFAFNTRKELKEECDYILEKQKQIYYKSLLKKLDIGKNYIVPEVIEEFSKRNILVTEFREGLSLDDIAENGGQRVRDYVGELIMRNTIEELFLMNYMQTDPNFSNYYYDQKLNKLIIIDFGAARSYDKDFCETYEKIIKSGALANNKEIKKYSIRLGFLTGEESPIAFNSHCQALIAVAEPFGWEGKYDFGSQKITEAVYVHMPNMMKSRLKEPPSEVYSLHRKLSGAYLICIKLAAKVDVKSIFEKVLLQKEKFKNQL